MNEQRVSQLAFEVSEFVESKVRGTDLSSLELSYALGEALALLVASPLLEWLQRVKGEIQRPGEEEEEEEGEDEFEYRSGAEKAYAFSRLVSKYPEKTIRLIGQRKLPVPKWLQKEILEIREKRGLH